MWSLVNWKRKIKRKTKLDSMLSLPPPPPSFSLNSFGIIWHRDCYNREKLLWPKSNRNILIIWIESISEVFCVFIFIYLFLSICNGNLNYFGRKHSGTEFVLFKLLSDLWVPTRILNQVESHVISYNGRRQFSVATVNTQWGSHMDLVHFSPLPFLWSSPNISGKEISKWKSYFCLLA